jgi:hypothetical protein
MTQWRSQEIVIMKECCCKSRVPALLISKVLHSLLTCNIQITQKKEWLDPFKHEAHSNSNQNADFT